MMSRGEENGTEGRASNRSPKITETQLVIATLNVSSLTGRLSSVLGLMQRHDIDVLCLQETRLSKDTVSTVQGACRRTGLSCTTSEPTVDSVALISKGLAAGSRPTHSSTTPRPSS